MTSHIVASDRDVDLLALVMRAQIQQGKLSVEVKPYVENRRRRQENLLRKWMRLIASETGNDPEVMHAFFKKKFLGAEYRIARFEWKGAPVEREVVELRSTTKLSVKEMSEYMTLVETFVATTLGIKLPRDDAS